MLTEFLKIFSEILEFSAGSYFCENIEFMIITRNCQKIRELSVWMGFFKKSEFCSCTTKTLIVVQP